MIKRDKTSLIVFLSAVILIFILGYSNYNSIKSFVESNIGVYGYPALFVLCCLLDFVQQPISVEVPGAFAIAFGLNPWYVFICCVGGIYVAGSVNFFIGRKIISKRIDFYRKSKEHKRYFAFFDKYDKFALSIAYLTPLPDTFFAWFAGAMKIKYWEFCLYGLVVATLRVAFILGIVNLIFS